MFRPLALFIGLRYTRAKRRNHFISFISLMSMLGIALGVLVLITVLSVMNGFDTQIKKRVFSMVSPVTVSSVDNSIANWRELAKTVQQYPGITAVAPFVTGQVLLTSARHVQPVMVSGIEPAEEGGISELPSKMIEGKINALIPGSFGIVLGEELADRLEVIVGDKVTMITPEVSVSPAGVVPRLKRFTVSGVFRAGGGFGFDSMLAFINLNDAQKLFQLGESVSGLHVALKDAFLAQETTSMLASMLSPTARITNWTQQFGAYFQAVNLEKKMMFFILLLIIAVAVFNLVCTLVMVVNEKEADIAILRTIGATPKTIMAIFIVQGATIGIVGTLLGVLGGIELALHVPELVNWIERIFHVQFISSSVYIIDYMPSELQMGDVVRIALCALGLSLLATLYPAWRASQTEPVEALRYE
jgi:lipoprotein-releasing system permease protein